MSPKNQNPHSVPMEQIVWLKTSSPHENPLKVILGPSETFMAKDGRPFVCIAELHAPTKCTYHCHPDNFLKMDNFAKQIALGMVSLEI